MGIEVKLEKLLRPLVPQCEDRGRLLLPAEDGLDIQGLVAKFSGLKEHVAFILINGRQAGYSDSVKDGDRVSLFSVVSGG